MSLSKSKQASAGLLLASALLLTGCFESPNSSNNNGNVDTVAVPSTYSFLGGDGASSVEYGGQTVRNLLIADIQSAARIAGATGYSGGAVTAASILKYYTHVDADSLDIRTTVASPLTRLQTKYPQIMLTRSLHDKVSSATVIGYGVTMDSLVKRWANVVATNSADAGKRGTAEVYLDTNGMDVSQMLSKGLSGAVAYYQATAVYLQPITTKDNVALVSGKNYTTMEHNWDEAFGYFGAARDYATNYSDDDLNGAATSYKDRNNDGKIDFTSEFNFSLMGRYTGRRDRGLSPQDWNGDLFRAFVKGRALISAKKSNDSIAAQRAIIVDIWEKAYAANVVSYIKATKNALSVADTNAITRASVSGAWSELKAFAVCLQFNPYKKISDAQLADLHGYIGNGPVRAPSSARTAYIAQLDQALALIKTVYGFSQAQIDAPSWL